MSETEVILVILKLWDLKVNFLVIQQLGDQAQTMFLF